MSGSSIQPISDEEQHRERTHPAAAADLIGDPVACSCELAIEPGPGGDILVVRVAGEIDMLSLHVLRDALSVAADRNPADLVVDLAGVTFCSVRGYALLADAVRTAPHRATTPGLLFAVWPRIWTAWQPCSRSRSAAFAIAASPPPCTPSASITLGSPDHPASRTRRQHLHDQWQKLYGLNPCRR